MTDTGPRIPKPCRDCGQTFQALGAWQTRCRTCYARYKAGGGADPSLAEARATIAKLRADLERARVDACLARIAADRAATQRAPIPAEQWRRLVQLCHPDRHGASTAAHEATLWLMSVRPG